MVPAKWSVVSKHKDSHDAIFGIPMQIKPMIILYFEEIPYRKTAHDYYVDYYSNYMCYNHESPAWLYNVWPADERYDDSFHIDILM